MTTSLKTPSMATQPAVAGSTNLQTTSPSSEISLINSLTNVTAVQLATTLPMEVTLSLLTLQEEVTFDKTLSAPVVQIIEKKLGRPTLIKLVCAVLKLFADSLNITQTFTPLQVYELAQLWIEQYPTDTLKDLILCLKRVKQGKYGKIYNRLDIEVFSEFWSQYLQDKAEYRESQHLNAKAQYGSNEKLMLKQISDHAPETAELIKSMTRPTPALAAPAPPTHEQYLEELKEKLAFASEEELTNLSNECKKAGRSMSDVALLINQELQTRQAESQSLTM